MLEVMDPRGQPLVCASCGRRSDVITEFRWVWRQEEYGFLSCRRVCTPNCDYASLLDEVRATQALCQRLYGTIRELQPAEHSYFLTRRARVNVSFSAELRV